MDAIGDIGNGLSNEVWWENTHPFKSSLMGLHLPGDRRRLERRSGHPVQPGPGSDRRRRFRRHHRRGQADGQPRTTPRSYVEAIKATDLASLVGPIKFANALPNCAITPLVGGQWIGKTGAWERKVVDNSHYPDIPQTGEIVDLTTL